MDFEKRKYRQIVSRGNRDVGTVSDIKDYGESQNFVDSLEYSSQQFFYKQVCNRLGYSNPVNTESDTCKPEHVIIKHAECMTSFTKDCDVVIQKYSRVHRDVWYNGFKQGDGHCGKVKNNIDIYVGAWRVKKPKYTPQQKRAIKTILPYLTVPQASLFLSKLRQPTAKEIIYNGAHLYTIQGILYHFSDCGLEISDLSKR